MFNKSMFVIAVTVQAEHNAVYLSTLIVDLHELFSYYIYKSFVH